MSTCHVSFSSMALHDAEGRLHIYFTAYNAKRVKEIVRELEKLGIKVRRIVKGDRPIDKIYGPWPKGNAHNYLIYITSHFVVYELHRSWSFNRKTIWKEK